MLVAGDEAGPVGYSAWWWVLALSLLALVALWNCGLLLWGREPRRKPTPRAEPAPSRDDYYLARIDQIEAAHGSGALSSRQAHQELSALVRRYVQEHTGEQASSMTLRELRDRELGDLVTVVQLTYPPAFAPPSEEADHLASVITAARTIVGTAP